MISGHSKNNGIQGDSLYLKLLLSADVLFISLHLINYFFPFLNNFFFSIESDRGYPEMYQYLKWFWIIILLIYISISKRSLFYIPWLMVFAYFFGDDAFSIHEKGGLHIAKNFIFTPPFGISLQDVGELAITSAAGIILLTFVLAAYFSGSQTFKKFSKDMFILVIALAFFGVVIDFAHNSIHLGMDVNFFLGFIEDGGEMLIASLMLWYVFRFSTSEEKPPT